MVPRSAESSSFLIMPTPYAKTSARQGGGTVTRLGFTFGCILPPIKRTSELRCKPLPHTLFGRPDRSELVLGCRGVSQMERRERCSPLPGPHGTHALEDQGSNFESRPSSLFTMYAKLYPQTYKAVPRQRHLTSHRTRMPRTVSSVRT